MIFREFVNRRACWPCNVHIVFSLFVWRVHTHEPISKTIVFSCTWKSYLAVEGIGAAGSSVAGFDACRTLCSAAFSEFFRRCQSR